MNEYKPYEIEKKSFEIITKELGDIELNEIYAPIIKRVIHTSADFEYKDQLCFSEGSVQIALEAIKNGADIVTDTQMQRRVLIKPPLQKVAVRCIVL